MPIASKTLFGNVPDKSNVALLMIDVINDLDFSGSQGILRSAFPMAQRLAWLKKKAHEHGCPAIYVNDNFGKWRSDFKSLVRHCLEDDVPGRRVVELLQPSEEDYFVLKPAHSGFFSTSLELLLMHLQAHTLIITGIATNICVQFTANDAYLRGYRIVVPADCVAANTKRLSNEALVNMKLVLKAATPKSNQIRWSKLLA